MSEPDQLQPEDTLVDRGVDDVLDEGISPPEKLRGSTAKGVTVEEQLEGETLNERMAQEEPDPYTELALDDPSEDADEDADPGDQYAGEERSGRLVDPDQGLGEDTVKELVGDDVGIDGAGASAEEAAVHIRDESDL